MRRTGIAWVTLALVLTGCAGNVTDVLIRDGERSSMVVHPAHQTGPAPTIVALHGGGGTATRVQRYSHLDALVASEGILVVYPEAADGHWNDGRPIELVDGIDDVGFLLGLVDDLIEEGRTDPDRVFVLGASNGGMMTLRLICEHPDRFAAAAVVIANEPAAPTYDCSNGPVPILFMHGTDDPLMPFAGGEVAPGTKESHGLVLPAAETVERWVRTNGCSASAEETLGVDGSVTAIRTEFDCTEARLWWIVLEGGGHDWPGAEQSAARRALLGSSGPIDATSLIWEFFLGET